MDGVSVEECHCCEGCEGNMDRSCKNSVVVTLGTRPEKDMKYNPTLFIDLKSGKSRQSRLKIHLHPCLEEIFNDFWETMEVVKKKQ